jgi:hypothetical protein
MFNFPKCEQPDLNIKLYDHQLTSIYNMEKLEKEKMVVNTIQEEQLGKVLKDVEIKVKLDFGILGNLPGFGKTLIVIGLLSRNKMKWDINTKYEGRNYYDKGYKNNFTAYSTFELKKVNTNLIVVPSQIIDQWEKELKYAPKLKVKTIISIRDMDFNILKYDIVLCSHTMYNKFVSMHQKIAWKRFIFDEAASVTIPSMQSVYSGFSWYVTATYEDLFKFKKGLNDMSKMFNSMSPMVLKSALIMVSEEYCKSSYPIINPKTIKHICICPNTFNVIRNILSPEELEMMNAEDIVGLIESFGGDSESEENIIELVQKSKKIELEEAKMQVESLTSRINDYREDDEDVDDEVYGLHIIQRNLNIWIKKVQTITNQLKDIEERYKSLLESDCCVCMEEMNKPVSLVCCQTIICGLCVGKIVGEYSQKCPMCRTHIDVKKLIYIKSSEDENNEEEEKKQNKDKKKEEKKLTKNETIIKIIKERPNKSKFIIFSNRYESFENLSDFLQSEGFSYIELGGHIATIQRQLAKFKSGEAKILLLNSKTKGSGLNLQYATDIIFYHGVSKTIEKQATGRLYRIGKKGEFLIHKLRYSEDYLNINDRGEFEYINSDDDIEEDMEINDWKNSSLYYKENKDQSSEEDSSSDDESSSNESSSDESSSDESSSEDEKENSCTHILVSGARKNLRCLNKPSGNSNKCYRHK